MGAIKEHEVQSAKDLPSSEGNKVVVAALAKNGVNLESTSGKRISGEAAAATIHDLAAQVVGAVVENVHAQVAAHKDIRGLTDELIDQMKLWGGVITEHNGQRKAVIEGLRIFRMNLTTECSQIETAVKKLEGLPLQRLVSDLQAVAKALENERIRSLLK